jgi:hypothetical protein
LVDAGVVVAAGEAEGHLRRVLREYIQYVNHDRPHQGLAQRSPVAFDEAATWKARDGSVRASPILHAYAHAA